MPNILWRSLPIERHDLQLPLNRDRGRQKTNLAIAGLIFDLTRNRDEFTIRTKRVAEVRRRGHLHVLAGAECALEDRHALIDWPANREFANEGRRLA